MTLTYRGLPLAAETTFTAQMTEEATDKLFRAFPPPEREVVIRLQPGQVWPKHLKRGQSVSLDLNGLGILTGRVRFRRLGKLVMDVR